MDSLTSFPELGGLVDLANRNVDIGPTLLRVLTDLYVSKAQHSREEERQYTALALRLLDEVDVSTRHAVAQRLSSYGQTPAEIVRRLARDVIAVAEPILRHSHALCRAELLEIAQQVSAAHVAVLTESWPQAKPSDIQTVTPSSALFVGRTAAASELNALFFGADAADRRLILLNLEFAPLKPADPVAPALASEAVRRLETAALTRSFEEFNRELMRALAIWHEQARQIIGDASGEAIVVAAKAIAMPTDALQRILLCLNPAISQSVQRIYDLTELYEELSPAAALRMVAIWQACSSGSEAKARPALYRPQYTDERGRFRIEGVQRETSFVNPSRTAVPHSGKKQG
jgi:hypothetical protein